MRRITLTLFGLAILSCLVTGPAFALDTPPPASKAELDAIGSAPSATRIERDVRTLVGFGTRHTLSDTTSNTRGIGAARRWVHAEFERISRDCGGCLEVRYVSGTVQGEPRIPGPAEVVSVIAIQRGTADPNRYVIMSGDIDSRVSDVMDATSDSPGANDNASGLAGTLEAARVLSRHRFAGSIVYAALAGEEQGLFGGKFLARYIERMSTHVPNLDVMMVYRLDRFGRGGHHRPFNDLGYPAVRVMETHEHYDRQHQDLRTEDGRVYGDTIDGVDFAYAAKLTALNAVTLAGLAWAPPPPANVDIKGAVSADTTLAWTRPDPKQAPNLAGYKLYWRLTTESQWTHSRWVGDVSSATLKNLVIDNFFFGVAAVAKDGTESPVVFPGAAGSFGGY